MKRISLLIVGALALFLVVGSQGAVIHNHRDTLRITSSIVPSAQYGQPYLYQLRATGGVLPYHWVVVSGRLPRGISLQPTGVLLGVARPANTPRDFKFEVQVADSSRRR